jgi:hypothetical protein
MRKLLVETADSGTLLGHLSPTLAFPNYKSRQVRTGRVWKRGVISGGLHQLGETQRGRPERSAPFLPIGLV